MGTRAERITLTVLGIAPNDRAAVRADRPTLLVTIEASVARADAGGEPLALDRSVCLVLPRGAYVTLRAPLASRVAVLAFHEPLFAEVARAYARLGVSRARLDRWMGRMELVPRTVWVHEIVHRYVFERYALGEDHNLATRFLETEILKELYFLFRDREAGAARASLVAKHTPCVARAIAHLESHLAEPCSVAELAARSGASESTLLRAFRRELGCTPGVYWRTRKLDLAIDLLRSGRHSIAEVAIRVGYENPTAFGHAFRLRFGRPPSSFRPRRPRRAPP